jgi:pyridoxal phosphate enzyme (YggS family)
MAEVAGKIQYFKSKLPPSVKLVAVSKRKPVEDIMEAYETGHKCFGENRVQELLNKKDFLPDDIEWHIIGHLQTNKIKYIASFISMIQSVDSYKLLTAINSEALKTSRVIDCLLQIHIAREESKFGYSIDELTEMIENPEFINLKNVRICGIMGMATYTFNNEQIRKEFVYLKECFNMLKDRYFMDMPYFKEISMGMSGDYNIALKEGSTMVRIGSLIFGERNTNL